MIRDLTGVAALILSIVRNELHREPDPHTINRILALREGSPVLPNVHGSFSRSDLRTILQALPPGEITQVLNL
jgi:hypothetical protein